MLWINEGFALDDSNSLINTTYIDLRQEEDRTPIQALVKGCRREFALEDGENVLISQPARFREYGEELIKDVQEGFAKAEFVKLNEDTAADLTRRQTVDDLNAARELVGSRLRVVHKESRSSKNTSTNSLKYGEEWRIFCAAIEPNDEDWETWRDTLPEEYNHVSVIGQPAKFAQALARMVAEQIGPQGQDGWLRDTTDGAKGPRTKHTAQWVMHGPVVYTDEVYDSLTRNLDERARVAAHIFTKSTKYAAQREYRFAVLNQGASEQTVRLSISGMMRDALKRTHRGLVRIPPSQTKTAVSDELLSSLPSNRSIKLTGARKTFTERLTEREETRREIRNKDGEVQSSEGERRERVKEKIVTQELREDADATPTSVSIGNDVDVPTPQQTSPEPSKNPCDQEVETTDEVAVQELALAEREWNDGSQQESFRIPVVHRGSGQVYKSLEEAFNDPAFPMSPVKEPWQEKACTVEEITKAYAAVDSLAWKIPYVTEEHRQDVASACWYAMQCIRNIYARFGDIVDSVWIERHRFVVIHLKDSEVLNATGRIVIAPSGAYAYCLQLSDSETSGHGGIEWHPMFFPIGAQIETFESYGWPCKTS